MMIGACPSLSPGGPFLSDMLGYIDCQAAIIGQGGYQALAMPGSTTALMLTGVLTIFIALFGYRMLLGHTPAARDAVLAVVKIGIVLMLATNWPAYRTLVYDLTLRAPSELAGSIAEATNLASDATGVLVPGLQRVDDELAVLQRLGTGNPQFASPAPQMPTATTPQTSRSVAPWDPDKDRALIANARTVYLVATIAAFGSVRLIGGILLALGPLFMLFLLFGGTRGLLEGWIRGLGGAALGSAATALVLAAELALLDPWLMTIIAERQAEISTPSVPIELTAAIAVFALVLLATILVTARVAYGFRLPPAWLAASQRLIPGRAGADLGGDTGQRNGRRGGEAPHTRAQMVADAVAANQRRESAVPQAAAAAFDRTPAPHRRSNDDETPPPPPLGQSFRRRAQGRVSAGASKRDTAT